MLPGEHAIVPLEVVGSFLTTRSPTLQMFIGPDAAGDGPVEMRYGTSASNLGAWVPFQSLIADVGALVHGQVNQWQLAKRGHTLVGDVAVVQ